MKFTPYHSIFDLEPVRHPGLIVVLRETIALTLSLMLWWNLPALDPPFLTFIMAVTTAFLLSEVIDALAQRWGQHIPGLRHLRRLLLQGKAKRNAQAFEQAILELRAEQMQQCLGIYDQLLSHRITADMISCESVRRLRELIVYCDRQGYPSVARVAQIIADEAEAAHQGK